MTWEDLAKAAQGRIVRGKDKNIIQSLSTDTRKIQKGQVFWALKGPRYDAHDFLSEEAARKAAGWVVDKGRIHGINDLPEHVVEVAETGKALQALAAYHRRRFEIPVIGITGSNGKTTTKEMLKSICAQIAPVCASPGNWNNHIGVPLSVLELSRDHHYGIFELADSKPGDIAEIAKVAYPTVAVITNIGPDHMEFYEDMDQNFKTKAEILENLPDDGKAAINADDPWLDSLESRLGEKAVTFGLGGRARVRFSGDHEMIIDRFKIPIKLNVFGDLSRYNACAAAAAAWALGIKPEIIRQGLEEFKPAPMRLERLRHPSGCDIVLDAYNANPASMKASVSAFCREFPSQPKILILGDMKELGRQSRDFHREIGEWLREMPVKAVYLVGPEMEAARHALAGASFQVRYSENTEELGSEIRAQFTRGRIVLLKASRAMKLETLLEGEACSTL
ncbi:MAG: UDP-N-acetylmuramoyl-tripeptide--D-alanyl-D-alanine ligase [Elusimicrobiota bacterium]